MLSVSSSDAQFGVPLDVILERSYERQIPSLVKDLCFYLSKCCTLSLRPVRLIQFEYFLFSSHSLGWQSVWASTCPPTRQRISFPASFLLFFAWAFVFRSSLVDLCLKFMLWVYFASYRRRRTSRTPQRPSTNVLSSLSPCSSSIASKLLISLVLTKYYRSESFQL